MGKSISVKGDKNITNSGVLNYTGLTREDLITMMEERFHHMLQKEEDIRLKDEERREVFKENRKLTDEIIRQNADFREYNKEHQRQDETIAKLTAKIIALEEELRKQAEKK